ncbi:hypothetical protein CRM22_003129, partial [Opisthorchis felineus]
MTNQYGLQDVGGDVLAEVQNEMYTKLMRRLVPESRKLKQCQHSDRSLLCHLRFNRATLVLMRTNLSGGDAL